MMWLWFWWVVFFLYFCVLFFLFMRRFWFVWLLTFYAWSVFAAAPECDTSEANETSLYNKVEYPMPTVPDSLRLPGDRADYATLHFWDAYRADAPFASDTVCIEQAMANFAAIVGMGSGGHEAAEGAAALIGKASLAHEAVALVARTVERCLNEEGSPVYDQGLYGAFVHAFAVADGLPNWLKVKYQTIDRLMELNAPGSRANDFEIAMRDGSTSSLMGEVGRRFTVLILYDPDCEHCETIMGRFAAEPMVGKWIGAGMVKVLAVDVRPSEATVAKAASLPEDWVVGVDASDIEDEEIFYVQSTPAFYLLAPDGVVILKDADATDVLEAIWMSRD